MKSDQIEARFIPASEWRQLVAQPGVDRSDHRFRRQSRIPVECEARLSFHIRGQPTVRSVTVLNASDEGLMVKATSAVEPETPVHIELFLEDEIVALRGVVQHSTESVASLKIGIELKF